MNANVNWSLIVPWVLTIVTAAIGFWQFTEQQRQANRQPFLEKQLDLSFQAVDAAGRLASETDPVEWEKARVKFWQLYWGPLSVVEDRAVESAMVAFGRLVPAHALLPPELPLTSLGEPSYRLAHTVRDLVLTSWQVDLSPLEGRRVEQQK
jgi:hypothetical protein